MIRVLSKADLQSVLDMPECIDEVRRAMAAYSGGEAVMPVRLTTKVPGLGDHLSMPAAIATTQALGMKCITIFPNNPERGAPILQGLVVLNDFETGEPIAVMDAAHLTAMRTAAASAVATCELARSDSTSLAIVGAGVQASSHLTAMLAVLPISRVSVASRTASSAQQFVEDARARFPDTSFTIADSTADALSTADVVCLVSSSPLPVTERASIVDGCHINGVGSHGPTVREVDGRTMGEARVIVDSIDSALRECGDCLLAIEEGFLSRDKIDTEIGHILLGVAPGRTDPNQITVYQSCGLAVQDVAVARLAYERAVTLERGLEVPL